MCRLLAPSAGDWGCFPPPFLGLRTLVTSLYKLRQEVESKRNLWLTRLYMVMNEAMRMIDRTRQGGVTPGYNTYKAHLPCLPIQGRSLNEPSTPITWRWVPEKCYQLCFDQADCENDYIEHTVWWSYGWSDGWQRSTTRSCYAHSFQCFETMPYVAKADLRR